MSTTTPRPQWTDIELYRQLKQEYDRRSAEYNKLLDGYRQKEAAGEEDAELKTRLEQELPPIQALYNQLTELRTGMAKASDAATSAARSVERSSSAVALAAAAL